MSAITPHIDRLRTLNNADAFIPTVDQIALLAQDVFDLVPLAETLERPEFHGCTVEDLVGVAEHFGKFRARVFKGSPKAETYLLDEFMQATGMLLPPPRGVLSEWNTRVRASKEFTDEDGTAWYWGKNPGRPNSRTPRMPDFMVKFPPPVIVPDGYDPVSLDRNVRASLAALVKTPPETSEIERFHNRHYSSGDAELTAEHVHLVWWLAVNDLAEKLDELDKDTEHLNGLLIRAHDLLETAVLDAAAALDALVAPDAWTLPVDELEERVNAAGWVNPGQFTRLAAVVTPLRHDPDPGSRLRRVLRSRLQSLADLRRAETCDDIAKLNEAHLAALVNRSGLAHDAAAERRVRLELRTRLAELGFFADLDQEVPAGVAAWRQGRLEDFYSSREARANGDPDWATLYLSPTEEAPLTEVAEVDTSSRVEQLV